MTEARMQETPEIKPGNFCWVELGTSDSDAAKSFYGQLFGWEFLDNPMGPDMVYTMVKLDGKDVGGLYKLMPDMVEQGISPHWMTYVAITNADEKAEKATAEGATVMNGPFDVGTAGRMAVIKDPTGAVFSVWQANENKGSGVWGVPGAATWSELGTGDTEKAVEFYSNVFGWTTEAFGDSYTLFKNDGAGIG
ncbi:MAG TPA: VOC family protein, partial [Anaerolineales bacterium]|nr:VOC family protein [Anaerolineales bacterium]